ncbi:MAG: alpha/beta hydrolase, partial [Rhodospirillales bacterium]|nr:alpha/beta hydrolase [Rhodospirillales bacterium]
MTDLRPLFAAAGANDLPCEDAAWPGRPMVLRSARPRICTPDTPVLFVHHGMGRNGDDYRDYWLDLVDEADLVVIAPEFPAAGFPGSAWYNFGNRTNAEGGPNPPAVWTYLLPGRLFAALRGQGLTRRTRYGLFGHSAGGQYVHRLLSLGLREAVAAAVTANAGTYALPDPAIPFPYGLGETGLGEAELRALLAFPMTIMAGTADVDATTPNFPREPAAMAQGGTRHARAHRYFKAATAQAARLGQPCAWRLIDVPDVAHDGARMSAA